MSLNDRKIKILQAIINDYIQTAEPVGSRTIAKKYDFGLSSATIRNEMSDLEEMGFIIQPHASAGRIPSEMGYRLYVDSLMQKQELVGQEKKFLQSVVTNNISEIELLMEETARIISTMTNYTTIFSDPVVKNKRLKKISIVAVDEKTLAIMIILDKNIVKNHIINVEYMPTDMELFNISMTITEILKQEIIENIQQETENKLYNELPCHTEIVKAVLKVLKKTGEETENTPLHLSGTKNILAFPEFSDVQKAKTLMQTLEEKETIQALLSSTKKSGSEVQIFIGNETGIEEMKDCSVITTTYKFSDNIQGSIAILGPTRMNYAQVVSVLKGMAKNIEHIVEKLDKENKNDS